MSSQMKRFCAVCAGVLFFLFFPVAVWANTVLLEDNFNNENGSTASDNTLNYESFAKWNVENGSVDLIGNDYFDFYPGNGLYVELDGTAEDAGDLVSKTMFNFNPGIYEFKFDLGGSQRGDANTVTVSLGSVYNESFTFEPGRSLSTIIRFITVTTPITANLRFSHEGGDNVGLILDNVRLSLIEGTINSGWILNPSNKNSYKIIDCGNDFKVCENMANAQIAHLVTVNDAAEQQWLLDTFGSTTLFWIGFTDEAQEGVWKWISGEPVTYTNWGGGQPDNGYDCENYAVMNLLIAQGWNDLGACTLSLLNQNLTMAIIEKSPTDWFINPSNNHYYKVIDCGTDWKVCENMAVAQGAHLVTVNDAAEQQWLVDTFSRNTVFAIGLTDEAEEGNWKWVSGEPVFYTNWSPGQPDNYGGQNYALMNVFLPGEWDDQWDNPNGKAIIERSDFPAADLNSGLVAYYPFNGNANDESGNGKHGIVSEADLSPDRFGNSDKAYSFDGIDDYIKVENLDYQFGSALSFSVWINPISTQIGYIINKWVSGQEDKDLSFTSEQKAFFYLYPLLPTNYYSNQIIPLNQWTHLTAVYDGSVAKIYINGVLDISQSASGNIANSNGKLYFAFNPDRIVEGTLPFKGKLDEIRIYNRSLSEAEIKLLYQNYQPVPFVTSYFGKILSVSPQTSDGSTNIQIIGQAIDRATNSPLANVPLNIIVSLNGFDRTFKAFTDATGGFHSTFYPNANESGYYDVRALHPESTDNTSQGKFTISRVIVSPPGIDLNIPRNYEQKIDAINVTVGGLDIHNLQLVYEAADQTGGVLPPGVHISTGSVIPLLSSGQSANLECTVWADNLATDTGKIVLKVKSDEKTWGTVAVNTLFSEAKPVLTYTPDHIVTGLALDNIATETLVLENKGQAELSNAVLSIVKQDGTPAPHWVHLNADENFGTVAVGQKQDISISFAPNAVAKTDAPAVAEGIYYFYLKISSSNYPVVQIPLTVTVTQSGLGNIKFKVEDIYTKTIDKDTNQIIEGIRVEDNGKIRLQLIAADGTVLKEYEQALDSKGETRFENLPTGRYKYRASADNHQEMIGTVWSKPGVTSEEKIFLAFNLVTVEWEVTETTIQDKYDIVLTAVYETDVPAPVVVAEPASISLPDMKVGDVLSGEVKFVNYGLIRAENVKFGFPESDEYLKYEILANNLPGSIESKEFITIPYRITCLKSLTEDTAARSRRDSGGCYVNSAKICISFGAWCINEVWYDFGEVCFYMSAAYGQCSTGTAGGGIAIGYSGGDGGSIGIFNPPAMQMAGVLCPPERICSTDDPCCLMDKSEPVKSQIDLIRGEYRDDAVDLSVKVPGHVVEVKRYFYDNAWHFADLTEHLEIVYDSDGKTPKSIKKHGVFYKKADEEGLVYAFDENRHIFKETDGYRWKDSSGNWKRYDSTGKILSYGNRMNQKVSFIYDSGILTGLEDNSGKQVLWYEYLGNDVSAVKDANGRMVSYTYESGRLSKVTDILGYDWIYLYDAQGRLETKQDPEGNSTTITYNDFGYVSKVSGSDGQFKSFDYSQDSGKKEYSAQVTDSGGKIRQVWYNAKGDKLREDINGKTVQKIVYEGRKETLTDVNGNQTVREFDEWHNLLKETYADGSAVTYTYEPVFHNKTGITDERGVITKYEYDDAGNRKRKIEAYQTENERITEYTYYPDGSLWTEKTVADAATPESVTTMEYDDNGNMISLTDAEGNKTTFTHNIMGQVKTKTDPKGKVWTYDYDDMGNLKSLTDPLGSVTAYEYDKVGNKIKDTDPAGNITLYEYDSDRHLKKITDAYGNVTQFVYTNGRLTKRIDPEGKEVTQEYDAYGRLWKSIDGNGNVITYEYEGADGSTCPSCSGGAGSDVPAKVIYPTNFAKEFQYDSRGRKEIEKDVLSADESYSAQFKYDFSGNLISETDKENHTTVYGYDKLGRKFKVTDAISGITEYTYDDRNNLISLRDANGSFTQFEYDRNNRLKKEIRPLGQTTAYEYDSAGSLIWKTDAKAQKTGYDYDDAGRMKTIRYYAASENTPQKTVNFDYYPNGTLKSYADGKTSAAYTYDKLNRKISETVNYGDFQLVYGYAYYKNGLKKTFTMPDGTVYGYTYDSNNQLTGIEIPGKGTIAYSAYKWNRPESVTLPGGVSKTFSYDTLMRLQGIAVKNPAQAVLMQYGYAYDKMNNIKAKQTEHGNYGYVYDPIYRLTTADNAVLTDETYTYDAVGNRKTDAQAAGEWMYNSNNELGSYDGTVFAYDANGNMTQKSGNGEAFTYIYDVENRLVQVENKADGSVIAKYYYDPFGRRLWKEVNGVKTCFLYADEGLVGEYNAAGAVIKTYGFKPNSIWTTDPVFMKQGNEYYFYHNDHLGTPVQMTDGTGNAAWSAKYDAFGRVQVGAEMVVNNLRFPGQYFDGETGLYYNWYRYYDAGVGRYVATDPLKDGVNLYVYVFENPLKWIDPLGLKCTPEEILKAADEKAKNDKGGDYCTYLCKWDNNLGTYFKPKCNLVVYDVLKEAGCNIPKIHNNKYPPIANEWGDPEYKKIPDWYFTDRYNLKPGDIAVKTRNGHSGHLFIYAGKDKDGNNEFYTLNTDSGIFRKIKESEIPQETRPTAYRGYFNEQQWKNEMGIE